MNYTINIKPEKTIVKTMVSEKSKDKVFDFFEDAKNLEMGGAISNIVKDIDEWYSFNHIVAGNARLKIINKNRELGIVDHLFEGGGLSWTVYVRIINNGYGSTTTWTFLKPDGLSDSQFEDQLKMFDVEVENWNKHLSFSNS
ncbi:MAG TPA: hypothetical protein VD815_04715 [Candidatus Saccharimonadales bacterium]|nr:hypothetical protein [Candidatus Saccharimonadales bacterium]